MKRLVTGDGDNWLVQMVQAYRATDSLKERLEFATKIVREISSPLEAFIVNARVGDASADILQNSLIAITKSLQSFGGDADRMFWAWCYTIARRNVANFLKAEKRGVVETYEMAELQRASDAASLKAHIPAVSASDTEFMLGILRASEGFCLALLTLRFIEGWNYETIAATLELPSANAARMRVNRCLESARALLKKYI